MILAEGVLVRHSPSLFLLCTLDLTIFLLLYVIVYNYTHDDDCDLDIQLVS